MSQKNLFNYFYFVQRCEKESILNASDSKDVHLLLLNSSNYLVLSPVLHKYISYFNQHHPSHCKIHLYPDNLGGVSATKIGDNEANKTNDTDTDTETETTMITTSDPDENKDSEIDSKQDNELDNKLVIEDVTLMDDKIKQFQVDIRGKIEECMNARYKHSTTKSKEGVTRTEPNTDGNGTAECLLSFEKLYDILDELESNLFIPELIKSEIEYLVYKYVEITLFEQFKNDNPDQSIEFEFSPLVENNSEPTTELMIQISELVRKCKKKSDLMNNKEFQSCFVTLFKNFINRIRLYQESIDAVNDQISMLSDIFVDNVHIKVHTETYPITIELQLTDPNTHGKLYLSFHIPLIFTNDDSFSLRIFLNTPTGFEGDNPSKLWQFIMDLSSKSSIFEICSECNDWFEERREYYQSNILSNGYNISYKSMKIALGLLNQTEVEDGMISSGIRGIANKENLNIMTVTDTDIALEEKMKKKIKYIWRWNNEDGIFEDCPKRLSRDIEKVVIGETEIIETGEGDYKIIRISQTRAVGINIITSTSRDIIRIELKRNDDNRILLESLETKENENENERKSDSDLDNDEDLKQEDKCCKHLKKEKKKKKKGKNRESEGKGGNDKVFEEDETRVYNPWELNCIIEDRIMRVCEKLHCSMSEAKGKLNHNLWNVNKVNNEKKSKTKLEKLKSNIKQSNEDGLFDLSKLEMNRGTSNGMQQSELEGINIIFPLEIIDVDGVDYNDMDKIEDVLNKFNNNGYIYECPICLESKSISNGIKLHCGDTCCISCLSSFLQNKIKSGNVFIKCPVYKCDSFIDECVIHTLCDGITYKKYKHHLQNNFLETSNINHKWCPNPKCGCVIKPHYQKIKIKGKLKLEEKDNSNNNNNEEINAVPLFICDCALPLCLLCTQKYHWPLSCSQDKEWIESCKDKNYKIADPDMPELPEFEGTIHKFNIDTKPCPKCGIQWEKNGGCNHITCRKCFYEFCWVCGMEWKMGPDYHTNFYNCSNTEKTFTNSKFESRNPTERYKKELKKIETERSKIQKEYDVQREIIKLDKKRTKRSFKHENCNIFIIQNYLKQNPKSNKNILNLIKTITSDTMDKKLSKWNLHTVGNIANKTNNTKTLRNQLSKNTKNNNNNTNNKPKVNKRITSNGYKSPTSLLNEEEDKINKDIEKQITINWLRNVIERIAQAHLILSRGYRYLAYYKIDKNEDISKIIESLECVVFKLDKLFKPKHSNGSGHSKDTKVDWRQALTYSYVRCEYYDLGSYMEMFITEMEFILHPLKKEKMLLRKELERNGNKKKKNKDENYLGGYRNAFINYTGGRG